MNFERDIAKLGRGSFRLAHPLGNHFIFTCSLKIFYDYRNAYMGIYANRSDYQ